MVAALHGKRSLVTGAASGIGRATALALREAGATVIGLDLIGSERDMPILACDLAKEGDIVGAAAEGARRLGGCDILVNNAGILQEAPLDRISADHVDRMFAVNVRGAILMTRETLPHLSEGGRIINIASELAYLGRAEASVYCATKAALLGLTRSWARELAPRILVNAVAPGPTDTPLLGFDALSESQQAQETMHPLRRIGRPEEIAAAVVFLAGPGATFFTGQCLGANGGAAML
ncbi:SDR family oxidoreductase [Mesorhizobium sp. VK25A]|uniref:SDR family oxidoreductase n=1 Tax=Mesorhizobium vachelliae TaxID=3072309 RepID=A0ABU4ZVI2_9HYPH|nr:MULTISPECIES: SDR family oxidoreductase [unclassified Mesorhizobium]MDX8529413.1 SDR family oxidoreductase [Mesorhizobium sp. VK25D]MDX8545623.1 SDR family oxidoreductase [Mesorhizobium sp. VK25A]